MSCMAYAGIRQIPLNGFLYWKARRGAFHEKSDRGHPHG